MPQVLVAYGIGMKQGNKAICPFHDDKNASMHVYQDGYHCYACGAYGDVIDFVCHYFHLNYKDAVRKLNDDFMLGLPLHDTLSRAQRDMATRAIYERRRQLEQQKAEQSRLESEYHKWMDLWIELDKVKRERFPQNFLEDITEEYAVACRNLDYVNHRVELALQELSKFERKVKVFDKNDQNLSKT